MESKGINTCFLWWQHAPRLVRIQEIFGCCMRKLPHEQFTFWLIQCIMCQSKQVEKELGIQSKTNIIETKLLSQWSVGVGLRCVSPAMKLPLHFLFSFSLLYVCTQIDIMHEECFTTTFDSSIVLTWNFTAMCHEWTKTAGNYFSVAKQFSFSSWFKMQFNIKCSPCIKK